MIETEAERKQRNARTAKRWRSRHPEQAKQVSRDNERRRMLRPEVREAKRNWNRKNQDRVKLYSKRTLAKTYGLSIEEYDNFFVEHGNVCAICQKPERLARRLSIDHDHKCCPSFKSCGTCIRGLLCSLCNQGIGCLSDDPEILLRAAAYLQKKKKAQT
jgi:hypothetical protein